MILTRREFCQGGAALTVATGLALSAPAFLGLAPAGGQTISQLEFMQPGPLPEMAVGEANAPVTVVEYASMTCPHCATFHNTVYPELKKRYVDNGKVRFIFREFPLDRLAAAGSLLARCAAQQGGAERYFAVTELLFHTQDQWAVPGRDPLPLLENVMKQAGFTQDSFNKCLDTKNNEASRKMLSDMQAQRDRASEKFGVNSTPTIFVNGKKVESTRTIDDLAKEIDPLLKS